MSEPPICRRCDQPVVAFAADYEVFERMHYTCFHYEFEHQGDPDVECTAGGCPASGISNAARFIRIDGVDVVQAANTMVPAIVVLQDLGFEVVQHDQTIVARTAHCRFAADDAVAVLGLVKLAESRRPWRATDAEIDRIMAEFDL